jgi:hypothetical protein
MLFRYSSVNVLCSFSYDPNVLWFLFSVSRTPLWSNTMCSMNDDCSTSFFVSVFLRTLSNFVWATRSINLFVCLFVCLLLSFYVVALLDRLISGNYLVEVFLSLSKHTHFCSILSSLCTIVVSAKSMLKLIEPVINSLKCLHPCILFHRLIFTISYT